MTVSEHYDTHLGPIYTWMLGDIEAAITRGREELNQLGLSGDTHGIAVDLGAGPGVHTVPLAEMGYTTFALEKCGLLAEELKQRVSLLPVRVIQDDLLAFPAYLDDKAEVILCLGDTLTHLPSLSDVQNLLGSVNAHLSASGIFCATFRDYSGKPPQGIERFIPVRSDESRLLICFLEYTEDRVIVHDILQERLGNRWQQSVSAYPKLRVDPRWVGEILMGYGLAVKQAKTNDGMVKIAARKG